MKILINDANILIDIVKLDLVQAFLSLKAELYTTDFVVAEMQLDQQKKIDFPKLIIIKTVAVVDLQSISELVSTHKGLSFEDCSVWHYCLKLNGMLITGDGLLRKLAKKSGLDVKGIIYIIDELKSNQIIPIQTCIEKLVELKQINDRLPLIEIDNRINDWTLEL